MCMILFGSGKDFLILRIHGRATSDTESFWNANWLRCGAEVSVGAFRGQVEWQLRNEDLARFMRALETLDVRVGEAVLDTLDGWLDVRIIRDEQGHMEGQCQLTDNPIGGNSFEFRLTLDQTVLPTLIGQLRKTLDRFPMVGEKEERG